MRQVAKQRCYLLRGKHMAHIYNLLVWLDETGTDKRGQLRKYGYALRGITPVYTRFISKGERMNAIASMSTEGIIFIVNWTLKNGFQHLKNILLLNIEFPVVNKLKVLVFYTKLKETNGIHPAPPNPDLLTCEVGWPLPQPLPVAS